MELLESIQYPDYEHICSNSYALSFNNANAPGIEFERDSIPSDDEEFFNVRPMDGDNDEQHAAGFMVDEVVDDEVVNNEVVDSEVVQSEVVQSEAVHSEEDQVMADNEVLRENRLMGGDRGRGV